jgi:hypothetical protein
MTSRRSLTSYQCVRLFYRGMLDVDGSMRRSFVPPLLARATRNDRLAGRTGEVGGNDVGGVPVAGDAGAVVPHRGARIGVGGGFLDVAQRDAGIERGGDECVTQRVRAVRLVDAGAARRDARTPRSARVQLRARQRRVGDGAHVDLPQAA